MPLIREMVVPPLSLSLFRFSREEEKVGDGAGSSEIASTGGSSSEQEKKRRQEKEEDKKGYFSH